MAWYRTGTITVTNGSPVVTGLGVNWTSPEVLPGYTLQMADGTNYEILELNGSSQLTLAENYTGVTNAAAAYKIVPTAGANVELHKAITTLRTWVREEQFSTNMLEADAKATPVDADSVGVVDSEDENKLKRVSLASLRTLLVGAMVVSGPNFGFGTENPASKIHGYGDLNGSLSLEAQNVNAGTSAIARFKATTDGGNVTYGATSSGYSDITGAADAALINTGSLSGGLVIAHDGVGKAWFSQNGHLGIGAPSDAYPLEVHDTNGNGIAYKCATNSVTNFLGAYNSVGIAGTLTNHPFSIWTNNAERLEVDTSGNISMKSTAQFLGVANTPSNPTYSFTTDTDTGITRPTADTLTFVTGGSEAIRIGSSGNVGHGTSSPDTFFHSQAGDATISPRGGAFTKWYLEHNASSYLELGNPSTASGGLMFSDGSTGNYGLIEYSHSSDALTFYSAGSEAMRIDSSGNVGVGTATPQGRLDVANSGAFSTLYVNSDVSSGLAARLSLGTTASPARVTWGYNAGAESAYMGPEGNFPLFFQTNGAERTRILGNGVQIWGGTSEGAEGTVNINPSGYIWCRNASASGYFDRTGSDGDALAFRRSAVTVGSISVTGSATSYNTSSDARLKSNVRSAEPSGEIIDAIHVCQFDWIEDGSHQRYGWVAQELEKHFPEAVHTDDSEDRMKSVDNSKVVPLLVKELQSLRERVKTLEAA